MNLGHGHSGLKLDIVFVPSAIQTAIRLHTEGKCSLHKDLKLKRREQRERRERRREEKEQELQHLRLLQEERERKNGELELLKEAQRQAQLLLEQEEQRRHEQHEQLQQALEHQLREAQEVRREGVCVPENPDHNEEISPNICVCVCRHVCVCRLRWL